MQLIDYQLIVHYKGGHRRIRTAVAAFAELSLTARPCDLFTNSSAKIGRIFIFRYFFFISIKKTFSTHRI